MSIHHGVGDAPVDRDDFEASFAVGYAAGESAVYVAVEVFDESHVLNDLAPVSTRQLRRFFGSMGWRSLDNLEIPPLGDGCAVIIDVDHGDTDSRTARFGLRGADMRSVFTSNERDSTAWRDAQVAMAVDGPRRTYEWRLDVGSPFLRDDAAAAPFSLPQGQVLSFDVTLSTPKLLLPSIK